MGGEKAQQFLLLLSQAPGTHVWSPWCRAGGWKGPPQPWVEAVARQEVVTSDAAAGKTARSERAWSSRLGEGSPAAPAPPQRHLPAVAARRSERAACAPWMPAPQAGGIAGKCPLMPAPQAGGIAVNSWAVLG